MKFRTAILSLSLCFMFVATAFAQASEPAHFVLLEENGSGELRTVFHRKVYLPHGWMERRAKEPDAALRNDELVAEVTAANGARLYRTVVPVASMQRTLHRAAEPEVSVEGPRYYIVRVPARERGTLRLMGKGLRTVSLALNPEETAAATARSIDTTAVATGMTNRVNVLFVGDGYTTRAPFDNDVAAFRTDLLSHEPYQSYATAFNFQSLYRASVDAGADYPHCAENPGVPERLVTTAFDATYCYGGVVWRLMAVNFVKVVEAATQDFPGFDVIAVIVNDDLWGGTAYLVGDGGQTFSLSVQSRAFPAVLAHELGHSIGALADEYEDPLPGMGTCDDSDPYARCEVNVTNNGDIETVKWREWIDRGTPGVGVFAGARYSMYMFRSEEMCAMRVSGEPFCHVCRQGIISQLYGAPGGWQGYLSMLDSLTPNVSSGSTLVFAQGTTQTYVRQLLPVSTVASTWKVDDVVVGSGPSLALEGLEARGYSVRLDLSDSSPMLLHPALGERQWTVEFRAPSPDAMSPVTGSTAGGDIVTITSSFPYMQGISEVRFGGIPGQITGVGAQWVTVRTPPHAAGCVPVTVKAGVDWYLVPSQFVYGSSVPATITRLEPDSGAAAGQTVTLVGAGLCSGGILRVHGIETPYSLLSGQVTFTTALTPGTINDVTFTVGTQTATAPVPFVADFTDVPSTHPLHDFVEVIFRRGITAGCGGGNYCPSSAITRAQMAVFLVVAKYGSTYTPPAAVGIFSDVPPSHGAARFIEKLYNDGVTGGCGDGKYCPAAPVSRAQMAVFLLASREGSTYSPPPATGTIFSDVTATSFAAKWIEELYRRGVTGGCSSNPLRYCPTGSVTRGQMAVFLTTAWRDVWGVPSPPPLSEGAF